MQENFSLESHNLSKKNSTKYIFFWLCHKLSGAAIVPIAIWLIFFIKNNAKNLQLMQDFFTLKNLIILLIFFGLSFYHTALGMKVIIDDYIRQEKLHYLIIKIIKITSIISFLLVCYALINLF